jgi:hypothetical protein
MKDILNALLPALVPVLTPLVTSGLMWVLNTYTKFVGGLANPVKQVVVVIVGTLLGWGGQQLGLDVSTVEGLASGLVALGIYQIGKVGSST